MQKRGAIILCGGKSSRMGSPKALLPIGDEQMLQRIVRLVSLVIAPKNIVVVSAQGQHLPDLPEGIQFTQDERPERGPLEGLAAGIKAISARADAAFATGCDVPFLKPALISHLFNLLGDHDIVVPRDGKFHHPLAAVYRTSILDQIQLLLKNNQLRPLFLFENVKTHEVPMEELSSIDANLDSFINCNSSEDYQRALEKIEQERS